MDLSGRIISDFDYIKRELENEGNDDDDDDDERAPDIEFSGLGKRILEKAENQDKVRREELAAKEAALKKVKKPIDLEEYISVEEFLEERKERGDWRHERHGTGKMANSVTSTYVNITTQDEKRPLTDIEMMKEIWIEIKSHHHKSYIQVHTNMGEMNIELFSD